MISKGSPTKIATRFFGKNEKRMKEKMLERFRFSPKLKDELAQMVMYKV